MHTHVLRLGRRIGIAIAGSAVILAGIVLAVPFVPGPGLAIIVVGLAILSLEFERPRLWLARLKAAGARLGRRIAARRSRTRQG